MDIENYSKGERIVFKKMIYQGEEVGSCPFCGAEFIYLEK